MARAHPYPELQKEYESWVANVKPLPSRAAEIDAVAKRLLRDDHLAHFLPIFDKIGLPVVIQATVCERESGCDFTKNPAQGDPWNRVSTHVPRGVGPFRSFEAAAIDAWTIRDQLAKNSVPWSWAYACFKWEFYNGGGYRARGLRSPYVVGGTNLQQPGKYVADGKFATVGSNGRPLYDQQLGCLPIAMRMVELRPEFAFGPPIIAAPSIVPDVAPVPQTFGGQLTGTKWVQQSYNLITGKKPVSLGGEGLNVDGSFGRMTRAAVRELERKFGLPDDGVVDDQLCDHIDTALAALHVAP